MKYRNFMIKAERERREMEENLKKVRERIGSRKRIKSPKLSERKIFALFTECGCASCNNGF